MTSNTRPGTQPLDPYSLTENRNLEEVAAFNAVASAAPIDPLRRPDLVAVWTGDLNRSDATAVVIKQTYDGERILDASPDTERYVIDELKDLTDQVEAAPRPELLVMGAHLNYIGATLDANHFTGCVVLVGGPEKFDDGGELHGLSVTGELLQRRDTDPSDAALTVEDIETLYSVGLKQRARLRIMTELDQLRGRC